MKEDYFLQYPLFPLFLFILLVTKNQNPSIMLKPIIYIALGMIIGIALSKLLTATNPCPQTTIITKPSLIKEQTAKTASHYKQKVDSLQVIAKDINIKIANHKAALATAKSKTLVLQTQLIAAKEKDSTNTESIDNPEENLLSKFIEANTYKDSLYETIDSTRVQQLQNKDTALEIKDSMYNALKESLDHSISQQEILFTQNKLLRSQVNRQKLKGKLVSAAILIASASAAHLLIKQ